MSSRKRSESVINWMDRRQKGLASEQSIYSPDFNPIEQVFAKLKAAMRAAGERTVDALWKTLGQVLDDFPPAECANFLRGAGYAVQAN